VVRFPAAYILNFGIITDGIARSIHLAFSLFLARSAIPPSSFAARRVP
jgi:hypothetical protein